MRTPDGKVTRFSAAAKAPKAPRAPVWRAMDCVDCHNRPDPHFTAPPTRSSTRPCSTGGSTDLPFVRREAVRLVQGKYPRRKRRRRRSRMGCRRSTRRNIPRSPRRGRRRSPRFSHGSRRHLRANVFPSMKIAWGTYPNHIGHERAPGCFRCHDEQHTASDGRTISQDCSTCHGLLAMQEENPEILKTLSQ